MEINIKGLRKSFGEQVVLDELELNLKDVHCLVIIGPSGGGKSTLLRILAGLEIPNDGVVLVNNEEIPKIEKDLHEYRKGVGVVFQAYNLFPHMSAIENIMLPLEKVHGIEKNVAEKRADELLKRFGLYEHRNKKPHQLSGGQQQRVAIVRALALEPKFLLLDEPTSALDPAITKEILDAILELRHEKKDMVLVTHEMQFAEGVADYMIYVDQGKVLAQGKPEKFFKQNENEELKRFLSL